MPKTSTATPVQPAPPERALHAPYPVTDAYPSVLGTNITTQTISSTLRLATIGYRQQYVDLLNELMERDPHAFAVLSQRIQTVAGGRIEIKPAGAKKSRRKRAKQLATWVKENVSLIRDLSTALSSLAWGTFYAVSALETQWGPTDDGYLRPLYLHFIHSRRLSYPAQDWSLHIVDNGMSPWDVYNGTKQPATVTGLRIEDYPGKFIVHTPQLRADYPTREGLGRQIIYYMALKGVAARGAGTFVERYARPPTLATYTTGEEGKPAMADKDAIAMAETVARGIASGTLTGATLPDSVTVEMLTPQSRSVSAPGLTHLEWLKYCDAQISLAVLLNSEISDGGAESGSRAKAEVLEKLLRAVFRFDARQLAQTLKRDLIYWMVYYNFPEDIDLCPDVDILIDDEPSPGLIMDLAEKAATISMPVDLDRLAAMAGLPIVPPKKGDEPRAAVLAAPVLSDDARARSVMKTVIDESQIQEADKMKQDAASKPGPQKGKAQKNPSGESKQPKHVNGA